MRSALRVCAGMFAGLLLVPSLAMAQSGNIAGVVKDTTGAVMPGVTVEASSPPLIEKVRSVVTDGAGQYKIIDLPPGVYKVTFTLGGFATVANDNIQLTTGFTATANAELKVGDVAETITVSGASPVVDVQNVTAQQVMSRETMDVVPTGKFYQNFGILIPGMSSTSTGASSNDVGGSVGNGLQRMAIHGGRSTDQQTQINGMAISAVHISNSAYSFLTIPDGDIEETNLTIGSIPAEAENGGVLINLVPKTGGNVFEGSLFGNYANQSLQAKNVDANLVAQGVPTNLGVKNIGMFNSAFQRSTCSSDRSPTSAALSPPPARFGQPPPGDSSRACT